MSTSVSKENTGLVYEHGNTQGRTTRQVHRKALFSYLAATVFCIVFSAIYEHFSHQVYSIYMIGMFLFPLLLGAAPVVIRRMAGLYPAGAWTSLLHRWGVATLTIGSCLTGVFEIYGTTSAYTIYYWIIGGALMAATLISYLIDHSRSCRGLPAQLSRRLES